MNIYLFSDVKPTSSPAPISSPGEPSSSPYHMTSLSAINNGGVSNLMLSSAPLTSYSSAGRSDPMIKVESPENLSSHVHYNSASPPRPHSGLDNERLHGHPVGAMSLTSGDSPSLGQVSVGAS